MTLSVTVVNSHVPVDEIRQVSESWRAHGASWSEGSGGDVITLNTVWEPHICPNDVFAFLVGDLRKRRGWHTPSVYGPKDRTREVIQQWAWLS